MRQIMAKKEYLNLFCVWMENCCKFEVLRANLTLIKVPQLLKEYLQSNEKNPSLDGSLVGNLRKIAKMIDPNSGEI